MTGIWKKLRVDGLTSFSLSPGTNPSIAVFLPERKGSPASSQIFSLSNLDKPSTQKQFYKADKIDLSLECQRSFIACSHHHRHR